jgi:hypothetical protein
MSLASIIQYVTGHRLFVAVVIHIHAHFTMSQIVLPRVRATTLAPEHDQSSIAHYREATPFLLTCI